MIFPQVLLTFYKESNPSSQRCAWANYNEAGFFVNMTNYYGEVLDLSKDHKISIDNEVWVLKDHLNKFYY